MSYWAGLSLKVFVIILQIQSVALSFGFSACSSRSLHGIGLADGHNSQHVQKFKIIVYSDLHEPRINHITYSRNSDTRFCDVSRQDNFPCLLGGVDVENLMLVFVRQCRIKHQYLQMVEFILFLHLLKLLVKRKDFILACDKGKNVSRRLIVANLKSSVENSLDIILNWLQQVIHFRRV